MNTQILGHSGKWLKRRACENESVGRFGCSADSYTSSWGTHSGTRFRRVILVGIFTLIVSPAGLAQTSNQESTTGELQRQLDEMRSQMVKLQNRIAELEAARGIAATSASTDPILFPSQTAPAEALRSKLDEANGPEEPTSFHLKGLTLTPGGFLEGTMLVRTRNENADIANTYSAIPLNGSSNAELSEFRGTARNSEFSLLVQGTAGSTKLKGYFETDFLGAAPTANYVESNSWTPRLRQLWVQLDRPSGWTITAGQMWSLLTTNQQGIATLAELRPGGEDGQYVVGFTWTRQRAFRVTKNFNNKVWTAFAVENPENTYSAAFVPANIMGLNTSQNAATGVNLLPFLPNYSNGFSTSLAPDLLAKVAFEQGWGHFEIKALGRFFRDRIASTTTTSGHTNTSGGYGVGFGALMPFVKKKLEVSLEGLLGQGIGRYGSSGLPDATLNPTTGELRPLREARIMGGLVYHRTSRLDLYTYGGDEYAGRYPFISPTGTAAGYGSPLVSYASCTNEVALNSCSGANRNIYEATGGYWYRLYRGAAGRIEQGNQIVYIHRNLWSGIGRTPQGSDIVAYTSLRFYLP
jgi:hypothetical protein